MSDDDMPDFSSGPDSGPDTVTETTTVGWGRRILGGFVGAVIGGLLVICSVVLLWWNEGRAVQASRALSQGAHEIVEVNAGALDPAAEGKLVHLSGMMTAAKPARDATFGMAADDFVRLRRAVEMYQWVEHKSTSSHKNLGGSETTETTYSYRKEWADKPVDAGHFHQPDGHRNPSMPVTSATVDAGDVRLGAYRVDPALLREVSAFARVDPPAGNALPEGYRRVGDYFYRGHDDASPAVGDIRVHYTAVRAQTVSAVAAASGGVLAPFHAANGYRLGLAEPGVVPASQMFREKASEERIVTWILRVVGFLMVFIGLMLMSSPLTTLLGVIPLLEDVAEIGIALMALVVAVPLTLIVIAAAWMAHRPLIGVALIAGGIGLAFVLRRLHRKPAPTHFLPTAR